MRMAPAPAVAFGRDQHMLAESGQQMTTDRTAIRRWLEIGGGTYRPPIRARKGRHRSIVAPLAATLAASAAVGLGVAALSRAGGERRRRRERHLGLWPEESVGAGLKRMAIQQAELAIAEIDGATPASMERAVHNARKSIKRLRTIVRLLEGQLGPDVCAREHASLRAAAAGLAGARDAEVMLATLERLIERHPRRLAGNRQIKRLRARMAEDRDRAEAEAIEAATRLAVTQQLRGFRARAIGWQLLESQGIGSVDSGLRRIYTQGRKRRRRARKSGGMRAMHQWRKRVKDLRYAVEILQRSEPPRRGSRSKRERARAEAGWLRGIAGRADDLGELLGEEHDLAVLGEWLQTEGKRRGLKRKMRRRLAKLIARRRVELRRRALRKSSKLYERSPEQFMARMRQASQRTGPKLS